MRLTVELDDRQVEAVVTFIRSLDLAPSLRSTVAMCAAKWLDAERGTIGLGGLCSANCALEVGVAPQSAPVPLGTSAQQSASAASAK